MDSKTYSFLSLGDSYTIGEGVSEAACWPHQLKEQLSARSIYLNPLTILAKTGWTSNDLLNALQNDAPGAHDLVSLLIGVNNQYQKLPFATFKNEFSILLEKAIHLASGSNKVFVLSIPDYGVTPQGQKEQQQISTEIDMYNDYIQDQCAKEGVLFINITEISRVLGATDHALVADALHPSAYQYKKWVEKIVPEVLRLI